mgnify:CR=1 FL=1
MTPLTSECVARLTNYSVIFVDLYINVALAGAKQVQPNVFASAENVVFKYSIWLLAAR